MLTTDDCITLDGYAFKSSPESCSSNSSIDFLTDPSDEDYLQLSSGLDIPALLSPPPDDFSLINSLFEINSPYIPCNGFTDNPEDFDAFEHFNSLPWNTDTYPDLLADVLEPYKSPNQSSEDTSSSELFDLKNEFKTEPLSPPSSVILSPVHNQTTDTKRTAPPPTSTKPKNAKLPTKRVPIQPKSSYNIPPTPKNKIVLVKDFNSSAPIRTTNPNIVGNPPPKVIVLENVTAVPVTHVSQISLPNPNPPVVLKNDDLLLNINNIDPKVLKRQQRKIKNRESACLSRKKKKDYLTSLEAQVKELTTENKKLKVQNWQLREQLAKYEKNFTPSNIGIKSSIVLCICLLSLGFHLDYIRNPFALQGSLEVPKIVPNKVLDHHNRNLLWNLEDDSEKNSTDYLPFSMCPVAINQSESARLVLELQRWIGKPEVIDEKTMKNMTKMNVPDPKFNKPLRRRKQRKYDTPLVSTMYSVSKNVHQRIESNNELQVFSPTLEELYSEFFEAINRQEDTFYVVSFSDHHMLLPALNHNKTRRPKMSLIMPSMLPNGNGSQPSLVPLMQIDCEVQDTRLIQVRSGSIPQHLRSPGNGTSYRHNNRDEEAANYARKKAYKPYFVKQNAIKPTAQSNLYRVH